MTAVNSAAPQAASPAPQSAVSRFVIWLRSEMPMISSVLQSALAMLVGLGLAVSARTTGEIEASVAAAGAVIVALGTRPFQVALLTGASHAVVLLLLAFGVHGVSSSTISAVNSVIVVLSALLVRQHVTPSSTEARKMLTRTRAKYPAHQPETDPPGQQPAPVQPAG
jgi:hypothetical protein